MEFMCHMTKTVEDEIKKILPDKFALIFDGWSVDGQSTHYIALIASFLHDGSPKKG